jgi:predicted metal-dependent enzyme (double-stranded beta helix superfamily)
MSDVDLATTYTVAEFMTDVKAILAVRGTTEAGLQEIGRKMQELSKRDDLFELGQYRPATPGGNTMGGYRLHAEPDDTLILSVSQFSDEHPTPVHTHNTWGVICGYTGRDQYVQFDRVDDGSREGYAQLKEVINRVITRGDAVWWREYPHDIHQQQALDRDPSWEIILMGKSTRGIERLHFDPANHQVRKVPPRHQADQPEAASP